MRARSRSRARNEVPECSSVERDDERGRSEVEGGESLATEKVISSPPCGFDCPPDRSGREPAQRFPQFET
jgi:hypothetical protein